MRDQGTGVRLRTVLAGLGSDFSNERRKDDMVGTAGRGPSRAYLPYPRLLPMR